MEKIENLLKQGVKIYYIDNLSIQWMSYLCVHPKNENYFIFIDKNEEPIRIYRKTLEGIFKSGVTEDYNTAKVMLIDKLNNKIDFWTNRAD